jgi:membrane-associated phospholipid phosphatase
MTDKKPEDTVADALLDVDSKAREAVIPHQEDAPVKALSWYSEIGDQPQLRALSAGLFLSGAAVRNPRMMRAGARMLLAHELATFAKNFVKHRVDRTRPNAAEGKEDQKAELGRSSEKDETSFPSGHSAGATAVAAAFAREFPEYGAAALAAGGAAALAQIPRCAHYPTDVGAGIAIGAAAEACVNLVWNSLAPEAEEEC